MRDLGIFVEETLEEMDPVISCQETEYGWRGLTQHGEVLEVRSENGHKITIPTEIIVARRGQAVGKRRVVQESTIDIDRYLFYFNAAVDLYKEGRLNEALEMADMGYRIAETARGKYNRAFILLALGRWEEGFSEYWQCELSKPFLRPLVERAFLAGLSPWRGEPITGKRVLLLHSHGFGDTIMNLRYARLLRGAKLVAPLELWRIAEQCVEVVLDLADADYFCPMMHLPYLIGIRSPSQVSDRPYIKASSVEWKETSRRRVGIGWSVGRPSDGDYPRAVPLEPFVAALGDVEIHSVQVQDVQEANRLGVITYQYKDFMDCAQVMMSMDEIVTADTAAVHLAGAIGHPKVTCLLSHWASWRWLARWYDNVRLLRQPSPGDWDSALREIGHASS